MISQVFIERAGDILGDTNNGLSGSEIAKHFSAYAIDYNIDIPHPKSPFSDVSNKRSALKENLSAFAPEQQFQIIKDLCELEKFNDNPKVKDLKIKLVTRFMHLNTSVENVNEILVDETIQWLKGYEKPLEQYNSALEKYKNNIFERNLLDDLRLSLELLVKQVLGNSKSLEKQVPQIGKFISENKVSKEFVNMFEKLIDYFTKYQNNHVKHDVIIIEEEIEFIFELTSSFMKHIIRMKKRGI